MRRFGQNDLTSRFFADHEAAVAFGNDTYSRGFFASQATARQIGPDSPSAGGSKSGIGFTTGSLTGGLTGNLIFITPDDAGNGIGLAPGNPIVSVGGAPKIGTIGTIGDQDFYKVTLEAGKTYEIDLFGQVGGKSLVPLLDSYVELYNASGTLLASADGGASTLINTVNSGFDAILTFQASVTGTYYINARAFGNELGDYALSVKAVDPNGPGVYHPYYDSGSPLNAIDWGSQVNKVNQTARNPDGNEGTRSTSANGADPTGNAQGTPVYSSLLDIPALAAAQGKDITGKNVITIYFAKAGDLITSIEDPTSPGLPPVMLNVRDVQSFEMTAVMTALGEFEKVADVVYLVVTNRAHADFTYTSYIGTPGPGISLLGSMSPPDEPDEGLAQFNSGDERWNSTNLAQGGFSFVTLIHEFGHGHGLAHPHDNGGHSGIMNGVEAEGAGVADYTTGDFDLNQGVFTMMSYEDGWQTSPYGNAPTDVGYGYLGGLMAFDIAAIQDKYGVNEDYAAGNDTYTLKDVNAPGTYYSSIWDGGGTDEIVYSGSRDANIDLRQATLQYEVGGGGFVSYATGIFGGFTIANGVTIENATSGSGNDTLRGNAAGNRLDGGAGADVLQGDGGADILIGGAGADTFRYASPSDSGGSAVDHITDFAPGSDKIDLSMIDANSLAGGDQAFSWIGSSAFSGSGAASAGQLRAYQSGGDWFVEGDTNGDGNADLIIQVTLTGGSLSQSDFLP
jgi:serralysin